LKSNEAKRFALLKQGMPALANWNFLLLLLAARGVVDRRIGWLVAFSLSIA